MHLRIGGVVMGGQSGPLIITDFTRPVTEKRGELSERLGGHGLVAQRQWLGGRTWAWTVVTNGRTMADAMSLASSVERVWLDYATMVDPRPVPLEYSLDEGRTWYLVYGRPGRVTSPTPDVRAAQGVGVLDLEFVQTEPAHFSALESSTTIRTSPEASGGLVAPVVPPIQVSRTGGVSERLAVNAGTVPTPVRARFHGPIKNPGLSLDGGWAYHLSTSLAWDEWLEVDALARTVTRGYDGQAVGVPARGAVSVSSAAFRDLVLQPGTNSLRLSGVDPVGTSYVEVFWRDASLSMR